MVDKLTHQDVFLERLKSVVFVAVAAGGGAAEGGEEER